MSLHCLHAFSWISSIFWRTADWLICRHNEGEYLPELVETFSGFLGACRDRIDPQMNTLHFVLLNLTQHSTFCQNVFGSVKWWCGISIPGQRGSQVQWGREVNHHSTSTGSSNWLSASSIYSCWSLAGWLASGLSLWLACLLAWWLCYKTRCLICLLTDTLSNWQSGCLSHDWIFGWLTG